MNLILITYQNYFFYSRGNLNKVVDQSRMYHSILIYQQFFMIANLCPEDNTGRISFILQLPTHSSRSRINWNSSVAELFQECCFTTPWNSLVICERYIPCGGLIMFPTHMEKYIYVFFFWDSVARMLTVILTNATFVRDILCGCSWLTIF